MPLKASAGIILVNKTINKEGILPFAVETSAQQISVVSTGA